MGVCVGGEREGSGRGRERRGSREMVDCVCVNVGW